MTYLKPSSTADEEPFAIVGMSATTGSFSTQRWDQSSATWIDQNAGNNGLGFMGKAYITCMLAASTSAILGFSVGDPPLAYQAAGVFSGSVAARVGADDTAISYGNSTNRTINLTYYSNYSFFNLLSRSSLMRMER